MIRFPWSKPKNRAPAYNASAGRVSTLASPFPTGASTSPERQMQAMSAVSTLFAIVDGLAENTGAIRWRLYRKARGRRREREEIFNHPALDLWNRPNPFMSQGELVESVQQHFELTGESVLYVGRSNAASIPLELWPVRPDRVTPVASPNAFISGYRFASGDGERIPWGLNEVLRWKRPNPLDPYRGLSPVASVLLDVAGEKAAQRWNLAFFDNSAQPGGFLETDQTLTDEDFNEWLERFRDQHQGVSNAFRVVLLEGGMRFHENVVNQRDMQFAELREISGETIRRAFRFPRPLLGDVTDINRANADAGEVVFGRYLLIPRAERIKDALNNQLLPLYGPLGDGLEFDYDSPVPANDTAVNQRTEVGVKLGLLTRDEGRALLGFAPATTDGDAFLAAKTTSAASDAMPPVTTTQPANVIAEPRCPNCTKRIGKNIQSGGELFCTRCKAEFVVQ